MYCFYNILINYYNILYAYIIVYIYICIICPLGVTSLYGLLNYRALYKSIGFQIMKRKLLGT